MIRANDSGLAAGPPAVVDEPARKGFMTPRNLIIVVGALAWILVIVLFVLPRLTAKPAPAEGAQAEAKPAVAAITEEAVQGGVGVAPKAVSSPQLAIPNRVFNLAGTTAGFKYVKLSVAVSFEDEGGKFGKAKGEGLKKLQEEFTAENVGTLGAFNDIMTTVISSKTAAELATTQGKESLRQELMTKFNRALAAGGSKQHATYVSFADFVMQ